MTGSGFITPLDWGRQTTADQLRYVLAQIRRLLDAHPRVDAASARARLIRFSGVSLDVEVFAYMLERRAGGLPGHSGRLCSVSWMSSTTPAQPSRLLAELRWQRVAAST